MRGLSTTPSSPGRSFRPGGSPSMPRQASKAGRPGVTTSQEYRQIAQVAIPEELPGLVLLSADVFHYEVASLQLDRPRSIRMVEANPAENVLVACFYPAEEDVISGGAEHERAGRILPVGVACRLVHRMWMPNRTIHAVFQGVRRIRCGK